MERDESPTQGAQSTLNAIVSSPTAPQTTPHTPATTGRIKPPFEEMHPGKGHSASSPSFDFRFARPGPILGPEAQRMMDELREEAARIKEKLAAEREKEKHNVLLEDPNASGARKIALPKGKVGRFSDAHLAEFKKMDSIENHPSAFRNQPGRPANNAVSLKRSSSKAKLDNRDNNPKSSKTVARMEASQNSSPAKLSKVMASRDDSQPATPTLSHSRSILASLTTPTQASLARSASVKQSSKIPTLSHSPSKHSLTAPRRLSKSVTMSNVGGPGKQGSQPMQGFARAPSKLDRLKSILHRPTMTSEKQAAMPHIPAPSVRSFGKPNLNKELPSVPTTPGTGRSQTTKHVTLTPTVFTKPAASVQNSPSPFKSGIPRSKSTMHMGDVHYPSLSAVISDDNLSTEVHYPALTLTREVPHTPVKQEAKIGPPSVPGTFTFRTDKTIDFGRSPRGFGASPGQSSIRQVRPSILPTAMPGTFPDGNKENIGGLPAIPHGLLNKKRHRVDSDDEKDAEIEGSPTKKRKGSAADIQTCMATKMEAENIATKSKIPSPSKKGVLSFSRLNMLARPKMRR